MSIESSVISNNDATYNGGGVFAIASGPSEIKSTTITENTTSSGMGGGLYLSVNGSLSSIALMRIEGSTIKGNTAAGKGGGLSLDLQGIGSDNYAAALTVTSSTISGNTSQMDGGGFFVYFHGNPADKFELLNSTVSGNHALAGVGGGGYLCTKFGGQFQATNSTVSGNDALHATLGKGGGLAISRQTLHPGSSIDSNLDQLTITNNISPNGGGLYSVPDPLVRTFVNHTIVSNNRNAAEQHNNVDGDIENTSAYNFLGSGGGADLIDLGAGNILNDDPMLDGLGYYGGPTAIHLPQPNSPVIDKGLNSIAVGSTDQRGKARPIDFGAPTQSGRTIDIGAVERQTNDP